MKQERNLETLFAILIRHIKNKMVYASAIAPSDLISHTQQFVIKEVTIYFISQTTFSQLNKLPEKFEN